MRVLKQLRQWMHLSKGKVLVGSATIMKTDVLPNWDTFHFPTEEAIKMIPAQVLTLDPSHMPVGTTIMVYYLKD